jgi:glycerol kinase
MKTLVLDIGTSGLRAAIVHDDGSLSDLHYESFPPHSPAPGLVEFDPAAMYEAVHRVACAALEHHEVAGVGLTCQRASTIVWRASTGQPIGPGLGWQDLRTVGECIMMRHTHGIAVAPNQTATKASWILNNQLNENERTSTDILIGTVDSWLVWKLSRGAAHVTDHTNAAVTGLTIASGAQWDDTTCAAFNISPTQLPRIVHTMGFIATALDLPGAPPIMAIAGDQQASLVGQGCISPGQAKITFGTGGMLDVYVGEQAPTQSLRSNAGTFPIVAFSHDEKIHYGTEAIMLSAGSNIEWLCDDMGLLASAKESDAVAASCATSDGVMYVPALVGLGTPYWDYGARGSLFGITRGTTRAHIVRAVLEGVAHRGADLVEAAEADSSLSIQELRIDGGMSQNATFVQALANASNRPVKVSAHPEATTLGAGFLAGAASGQWSHLNEAISTLRWAKSVDPLGNSELGRQQWAEAISRSRAWIPDLSALDF